MTNNFRWRGEEEKGTVAHESQNTTFQTTKEKTTFHKALYLTRRHLTEKTRLCSAKHDDISQKTIIHKKSPQLKSLYFLECYFRATEVEKSVCSVNRVNRRQREPAVPQLQSSQQGLSAEESGGELPVKQNHYTVNPQSIFIWPRCKKLYKVKKPWSFSKLTVEIGWSEGYHH